MRIHSKISLILIPLLLLCVYLYAHAQVPPDSFYHDRGFDVPYAKLTVTLPDGSKEFVPFTPVLVNNAPAGIDNYSHDIYVQGRLVFAGNGIVSPDKKYTAYGDYDLQDRIPVIIYNYPSDFQRRYGEKSDLHIRAQEAVVRGARALIVFGIPDNPGWHAPFISLPETYPPVTIPVIAISFNEALSLLKTADIIIDPSGRDLSALLTVSPVELPVVAGLFLRGNFGKIQSDHFKMQYLPGILTESRMTQYVQDKERAFAFVKNFLQLPSFEMPAREVIYFPDFASLRFYTGISKNEYPDTEGRCKVFSHFASLDHPVKSDYFHIVQNISHTMVLSAWGESDPVIEVGTCAMIAEAGDEEYTIDETIAAWLKQGKLTPLPELFRIDSESRTALPDSVQVEAGSFLKFLFTAYHVEKFRQFYDQISTAKTAKAKLQTIEEIFEQDLKTLEKEWAEMLGFNYYIPVEIIDDFLERSELLIDEIMKGKY